MPLRLALFVLLTALAVHAAEIRGKVVNVVGGEALGRVQVSLLETGANTTTADDGTFTIPTIAPGNYTLRLNAVGYRLATIPVTISAAEESKEFPLTLAPDNFRRTETVEVAADLFQGSESPAVIQTNLSSSEIRETSTVIADDPFRAVQALPGVAASANNDFFAQFSVMGAPFDDVAVYLDDVLVQRPFHGIPDQPEGASLSLLTSETVEEIKLLPVAYPVKYADAVGAALDVHTRDGSFAGPLFRVSVGMAETELLGEGGLGQAKRGSWLASARKSYLGYLLQNRLHQNYVNVGFYDAALKLTYDVAPNHNLNLYVLSGHSDATQIPIGRPLTVGEFKTGANDFTVARTGWRWGITPHLLLDTHAAYVRQPYTTRDPFGDVLATDNYGEWLGGGRIAWSWSKDSVLEAGWTLRRLDDIGYAASYDIGTGQQQRYNISDGTALRNTGYAQQSAAFLDGKLHLTGGLRWDAIQNLGVHPFSGQASLSLRAAARTELQFGAGRFAQLPTLEEFPGSCFLLGPMPDRSDHFTAAVEQRVGESTRLQLQLFDRQNERFLALREGTSCASLHIVGGPLLFQRNYSRGAQLVLQRRSSTRLSGWLGYTLVFARQRYDSITVPQIPKPLYFDTPYYPTLEDQRHSLHLFANYRLKPTLNLSGKWVYGSGFPVPSGLFILENGQYVSLGLNETRLGAYQRLDLRADKDWAFRRWKLTLYGEVLNLTNHDNLRYVQTGATDLNTRKTTIITEQGLPVTPTGGVVFQF
ncbi:MAG TPA: TonB-dependent receptor [Terriglobales bacterium]|nr:TonB-dependent receptor [Terriglobales bacterium]